MKPTELRLSEHIARVWSHRWLFVCVGVVTFILSAAYILCFPRYYRASVKLVPETEGAMNLGGLASIASLASSFGVDIGAGQSYDAISPEIYPDLFMSTDFVVELLPIGITTYDGELTTDYGSYLRFHQKGTPWAPAVRRIRRLLKPASKRPAAAIAQMGATDGGINAFMPSEDEFMLLEGIKENITCSIDKKSGVITIQVQDQDRLVAATMADSVRTHLQEFIIRYRTGKARVDADHYASLCASAERDYEAAIERYGQYADTHSGSLRQSFQSRREALETEMQLQLTTLNALRQQLQAAQAKVQERTPAFTVLEGASVPVKAAGPKRVIFVLAMLILAMCATYAWLLRDVIRQQLGLQGASAKQPAHDE